MGLKNQHTHTKKKKLWAPPPVGCTELDADLVRNSSNSDVRSRSSKASTWAWSRNVKGWLNL